jgi:SpoVK/Ycf46/Vps4 family AAA+-type ATPase
MCVQALGLTISLLGSVASVMVMKWIMFPPQQGAREARKRLCHILGVNYNAMPLNEYELQLVHKVVGPKQIDTRLEDVAGLEELVTSLAEDARFLQAFASASSSSMLASSKGLLLYGPPGTGKTMIAKVCSRAAHYGVPVCYLLALIHKKQ